MQTLINKNEELKKEVKQMEEKLTALKNKPIRRKVEKKKSQRKKSMFNTLRGLGKKKPELNVGMSAKQAEAINHIHELLLKQAYEEVDMYLDQNRKVIFGKLKKNEVQPTAFQLRDEYGESVLVKAIREGMKEQVLDWIQKKTVDMNTADKDGYTPLMVAALFGENEIVEKLVEVANKDAKTKTEKKTALHFAAEQNRFETCQILLDSGSNPLIEDNDGRRAYEYCTDGKTRALIVAKMKEQDSNVEIEEFNNEGEDGDKKRTYSQDEDMRPLFEEHEALLAQKKRLELQYAELQRKRAPKIDPERLKLKPKKNNNLNERVRQLHLLVARGNDGDAIEQVEELLTEKNKSLQINKDEPDELGETALMKAARLGFTDMLDLLLLYKCNVELRDETGQTALMKAANYGKKVCVEKLIQDGADVNANSRKGKFTAVMLAAQRGHAEICEILIREGADHSMINSEGQTALDMAKTDDCKERLEKVMAENPVSRPAVQI